MQAQLATGILMYFLLPLWIAAGLVDWWFHRRTGIEHNAGIKESLMHVLMLTEVGVPLLAGLFLEVNAGLIVLMVLVFFVHEATALWDVSYAVSKREVSHWEQHVHSFLEMIPLMAILMLVLIHADQSQAVVGQGVATPSFSLELKHEPVSGGYVLGLFLAVFCFSVVPYANELWRCLKARHAV